MVGHIMRSVKSLRAAVWLFIAASLLAVSQEAKAEWKHLSDSTVWDQVGALFTFRLVRNRDDGKVFLWVVECRAEKALVLSMPEGEEEFLTDASWVSVRDRSVGKQVTDYACSQKYKADDRDQYLASLKTGRADQWNRVGELLSFRLTWVKVPSQTDTEVLAISCKTRSVKLIASVSSGDKTLVNHRWRIIQQDDEFVEYACGSYRYP
jgi:hypothetical protein